jgi:ubiquinone biosynthesis protein COQ4
MTNVPYTVKSFEKRRRRPLKALHHFRKLMADKEDTTQVFYVIEALNGNSFQKQFVKFANSEKGQTRLKEKRYLPAMLDNHEWLRTLPDGSLGRAYLDFMTREGLTAQGLVDEYDRSGINRDFGHPEMNIYGDRLRDSHDMLHVLTGFGRDAIGEASVLGYTYAQHGGLGVLFIAYGAAWEVRKSAPKGTPVFKSVNEARRIGKAAQDIVYEDIMDLLPLPLEEVRAKLGITLPTQYHAVHAKMRENGIDPYAVIGANVAAA